jgi:hypothetical protein
VQAEDTLLLRLRSFQCTLWCEPSRQQYIAAVVVKELQKSLADRISLVKKIPTYRTEPYRKLHFRAFITAVQLRADQNFA